MNRKTILTLVIALIALTAIIAYSFKSATTSIVATEPEVLDNNSQTVTAPKVATTITNHKPSHSVATPFDEITKDRVDEAIIDELMTPPERIYSNSELAGPVNNEYGIRDDILEYIKTQIPSGDVLIMKAAITYASTLQFIYHEATREEALEAIKRNFLSYKCLRLINPKMKLTFIAKEIDNLMRNSPDRDAHMWEIDKGYFGWEIIGTGLSSMEQRKVCAAGQF